MTGNCKLFDKATQLMESHIYPKFVIDFFKTTGSKYFRRVAEPNRRMQDGIKMHLLSREAEQLFSISEKWFAENMFKPYQEEGKKSFEYNERLFKFSISFLWRVLLLHHSYPGIAETPYYNLLLEAQEDWKYFLRENRYPVFDRIYIFLTDRVVSHTMDAKGVDYYMTRALDATVISNNTNTFVAVYGKFLRFTLWGVLKGANDENKIADLRIHPTKGVLTTPQRFEETVMTSFFYNRIKEFEKMQMASEKQQETILGEMKKDMDGFLRSDAGRSMFNDLNNLDH
jgi:hypothetical protein